MLSEKTFQFKRYWYSVWNSIINNMIKQIDLYSFRALLLQASLHTEYSYIQNTNIFQYSPDAINDAEHCNRETVHFSDVDKFSI